MSFAILALGLLWLSGGCGDDGTATPQGPELLVLTPSVEDPVVVFGGSLTALVDGASLLRPAAAAVALRGNLDGEPFEATFPASLDLEASPLRVSVSWDSLQAMTGAGPEARFEGVVVVIIDDISGQLQGRGAQEEVSLRLVASLSPDISSPPSLQIHLNEETAFPADGVLRPGEGDTTLELRGLFTANNGGTRRLEISLPARTGEAGRLEAAVVWAPNLFGVRPGTFEGTIQAINTHRLGSTLRGPERALRLEVLPSTVTGFDPPGASRGQRIRALGRGFIPLDPGLAQSMFFQLEGEFVTIDGQRVALSGGDVLRLAPDDVPSHREAVLVLRTETTDLGHRKVLTGLTARPGTFTGTVTPVLVDATAAVEGEPFVGNFTIEPTEQYVLVKFLPGFSEALVDFGLRNVEFEIRDRVFEVLARDFQGLRISFSDQRPDDFAEFSIIEVGGVDPNGVGLLGLDNTAGKDVGNIRLDDVIGGENAESGELGFYVFGGVFIRSFSLFSPSLGDENDLAHPEFDRIFSPFMPELGGTQVEAGELNGGPRQAQLEEAVFVMGNLIGNTITHEIGHSLGLAFFEEDFEEPTELFHNEFDEPNAMMDNGRARPFEERAEINGQGPARFNPKNQGYLLMILGGR